MPRMTGGKFADFPAVRHSFGSARRPALELCLYSALGQSAYETRHGRFHVPKSPRKHRLSGRVGP